MLVTSNQAQSFLRVKNKPLRIVTIAPRGTGKTTLLAACCSLHKASPETKIKFCPSTAATQQVFDSWLGYISERGEYPPATPLTQTLNLEVSFGSDWRKKTLALLEWVDLPGEICTHNNSEFLTEILQADAFLVLIDAKAAIAANRQELDCLFEPVIELAFALRSLVTAKKYAPVAIVFTKSDRATEIETVQKLRRIQELLTEAISEYSSLVYQIFDSGTKLVPSRNGYVLKNPNCLKIMATLADFSLPVPKREGTSRWKVLAIVGAIGAIALLASFGQQFFSNAPILFNPPLQNKTN